MFFLPCLLFLVVVQCQNFMLNQTTNSRFSKFKRTNVSEAQIAALAEESSSEGEDAHQTPASLRSRQSRLTNGSFTREQSQTCGQNCTSMFCGAGHFKKQQRFMKKFARDPNRDVNQQNNSFNQFLLKN